MKAATVVILNQEGRLERTLVLRVGVKMQIEGETGNIQVYGIGRVYNNRAGALVSGALDLNAVFGKWNVIALRYFVNGFTNIRFSFGGISAGERLSFYVTLEFIVRVVRRYQLYSHIDRGHHHKYAEGQFKSSHIYPATDRARMTASGR
jgi:hypothetical protein